MIISSKILENTLTEARVCGERDEQFKGIYERGKHQK
jgi:hypothetical protein